MTEQCPNCATPMQRARCVWCDGLGWTWHSGEKGPCGVCGGTGGRLYCPTCIRTTVYTRLECPFNYCDSPKVCEALGLCHHEVRRRP